MAKPTKKQRIYGVSAEITATVSVDVFAASLEEAYQKALTLEENAFVDYHGDLFDSSIEVVGIYKS